MLQYKSTSKDNGLLINYKNKFSEENIKMRKILHNPSKRENHF